MLEVLIVISKIFATIFDVASFIVCTWAVLSLIADRIWGRR